MERTSITERIITILSNILFASMFIVVLIQIIARFIMRNPFIWTEELARILYVWLIFFGSSTLIKKYEHISIDMLPLRLSDRGKHTYKLIIDCLALVFYAIVLVGGIKMMKNTHIGRLPCNPWIRVSYLYLSLVVGSILSGIFLIENIVRNIMFSIKNRNTREDT